MSKIVIEVTLPRRKRRASELFSMETNFRPKVVDNKKAYRRKQRHKQDWQR